jgi:uncharacterized protein YcbX
MTTESLAGATGRISSIWRYPVKSMLGEALDATEVTGRGLVGDRAYAMVDSETGKVVSAKNPKRWPNLFAFHAAYGEPPRDPRSLPAARIRLPDGETLTTDQPDAESRLSDAVGRPVRLERPAVETATAEGYWPDHDWLAQRDEVFDFAIPPGTFFDAAAVHLVTSATLNRLKELAPSSRIEIPRFRPNFVIDLNGEPSGFVEDAWIGRTVALGDVHVRIDGHCPRCIMTTLAQGDLPKDPGVLRAAVQGNGGNVGVYGTVVQGGQVRIGDEVRLI